MSPIQTTKMTNYRWVICSMLFFATTINYMDRQVLSLTWKDFIAPEFGWTDRDYGRITSYFSLTYAVGMLFAGKLVDRIGVKTGFAWAMGLWTFGAIMHAFCGIAASGIITGDWLVSFDGARDALHDFGATGLIINTMTIFLFNICRVVLAVGQSACFPAAIKATAEYFPKKDRAFSTAVFNTGASVGALFAPLIIPPMAAALGWEMAFVIVGAMGYLWMLVWILYYHEPRMQKRVNFAELNYIEQDNDPVMLTRETVSIGLWRCFTYRQTWAIIVGKFMTDGVWWFFLFWAPVYITEKYAYSSDSAMGMALVFLIYLISLVAVFGGYLPTHFVNNMGMNPYEAKRRAMLISAMFQLIGLFTVPLGNISPWLFVMIIGIQGAAHQSWSANLFSMVGDVFPKATIATITGIAGAAGGLSSYLVLRLYSVFLTYAEHSGGTFEMYGYQGKEAAYLIIFTSFSMFYLIGWCLMRLIMPRREMVMAVRRS